LAALGLDEAAVQDFIKQNKPTYPQSKPGEEECNRAPPEAFSNTTGVRVHAFFTQASMRISRLFCLMKSAPPPHRTSAAQVSRHNRVSDSNNAAIPCDPTKLLPSRGKMSTPRGRPCPN